MQQQRRIGTKTNRKVGRGDDLAVREWGGGHKSAQVRGSTDKAKEIRCKEIKSDECRRIGETLWSNEMRSCGIKWSDVVNE